VKGHLDLRSVDFTYPWRPNIPVLRGFGGAGGGGVWTGGEGMGRVSMG